MKISARNQIAGKIIEATPGAVNGTVNVDIRRRQYHHVEHHQ